MLKAYIRHKLAGIWHLRGTTAQIKQDKEGATFRQKEIEDKEHSGKGDIQDRARRNLMEIIVTERVGKPTPPS